MVELAEIDRILKDTFGDSRFSRSEKQALSALLADYGSDRRLLGTLSSRAFDMARDAISDKGDQAVLNWLEGIVKVVQGQTRLPETSAGEVYFSPGPDCRSALVKHISSAKQTLDICVFTITDNHLRDRIVDAAKRGVKVRIISDNEKLEDIGSDIDYFVSNGVPVKIDETKHHMHHKFAIFDDEVLATGSYNWTRSAFGMNNENLVMLGNRKLINAFRAEFDRLWVTSITYK